MTQHTVSGPGMEDIRRIFVAECVDGLDVIECGLLALDKGAHSQETINDIFRGAHSIKGGAATFGYSHIADFTHVMETLLESLRARELAVSTELVQLFLEAVDCLREMVDCMDVEGGYDKARAADIKGRLSAFLDADQGRTTTAAAPAAVQMSHAVCRRWDILFKPKPEFLRNGNQPQHLFRALATIGTVTLQPLLNGLPPLSQHRCDELYIGWQIVLDTDADKAEIDEIFDWVELDAEIEIVARALQGATSDGVPVQSEMAMAPKSPALVAQRRGGKKASGSIRVDIDKIDVLLNLVGELVINQSMLNQISRNAGSSMIEQDLEQGLAFLDRTTRELQHAVMQIRMLPLSVTFSRFPRLVYDLGARLNKNVELKITGEQTELDKTILERIGDPLLHLIRNALDHGVESPEQRLAMGKPESGLIHLSASHEGGGVVIRVSDDGAGLDTDRILQKGIEKGLVGADDKLTSMQIHDLIFRPGFSTADVVSDISGRGVGMDVVRSYIEEIGGRVDVYSVRDEGSTFQITLPLTLAILDGQLVRVGSQVYVLPLLSIVETVRVDERCINIISGREVVYRLRGEAIPMIDMCALCKVKSTDTTQGFTRKQMIIVESDRQHVGLVVDELLDQHQVVIKSLEANFVKVPGMLGATILGDGSVSLIIDVTTLRNRLSQDNVSPVRH